MCQSYYTFLGCETTKYGCPKWPNTNPLHHDKYTNENAIGAMGIKEDNNPLNHDRYTNENAIVAMGTKEDNNPLHHDRYADSECLTAVSNAKYALQSWVNNIMPIGSIMAYAGDESKIPDNWLECNGRSLSTTEYSELYSVLMNMYGGDAN